MSLKWTDVLEIAIQLDESKPEVPDARRSHADSGPFGPFSSAS